MPQMRMSFATIEERVRSAETAGFDSVWLMDHLAPPAGPEHDCLEGWTVASALAARTEQIRIGHLVLCNPFRHPALLAKMAATLDVISDGRLELGLGWGSVEAELRAFGFGADPARVRAEKLEETLQLLDLFFTGEPVHFAGDHFTIDGALTRPRPVQDRVPIHIGGAGATLTMPIVARHADWWNCPSYGVDRLAELRPHAGRAKVSVQHPVGLASNAAELDEVRSIAERRFGAWGGLVTGTPEELVAALRLEVEAGVEMFIVQLTDFARTETIELFGREVIAAFP